MNNYKEPDKTTLSGQYGNRLIWTNKQEKWQWEGPDETAHLQWSDAILWGKSTEHGDIWIQHIFTAMADEVDKLSKMLHYIRRIGQ